MLHGKCASPTIMVLAPTRELAAQIYREALRVRLGRPPLLRPRRLVR